MTEQPIASPPPRNKLMLGIVGAVLVAIIALVAFILPAAYGIDPTDAERVLGITKAAEPEMSEEQIRGARRSGVLTLSEQPLQRQVWDGQWEVVLAPYEGIGLKYSREEGAAMDYVAVETDEVEFDLHSHSFEGGSELTEGYALGQGNR